MFFFFSLLAFGRDKLAGAPFFSDEQGDNLPPCACCCRRRPGPAGVLSSREPSAA